jgi:homoserine kinase
MSSISVFAPASIGNIGIGFDIMGLCIERPGDEVVARFSERPGVRITRIHGGDTLPLDVEKNTAGVAVLRLLEHLGAFNRGIELEIFKKMPSGSGLGSSAASAVAGAWAVSELLQSGLTKREVLRFACLGEQVASGGFHADNVAPSLLGGITLIRDNQTLDVFQLPVPPHLHVVVVHPEVEVLTKNARAILQATVPLKNYVQQTANIAAFVTALYNNDDALLGRSLNDVVIEPQRAGLIPAFYDVKQGALDAGALGCSISGSGPSVFALCTDADRAQKAGEAMQHAFSHKNIRSTAYVSKVNVQGAVVTDH